MRLRRGGAAVVAALVLAVLAVSSGCSDPQPCDVEVLLGGEQQAEDELSASALSALPQVEPDSARLLAELTDPEGRIFVARDGSDQVCLIVEAAEAVAGCNPAPATHLTVGHPTYTAMLTNGVATDDLADDGWELLDDAGCLAVRS